MEHLGYKPAPIRDLRAGKVRLLALGCSAGPGNAFLRWAFGALDMLPLRTFTLHVAVSGFEV